MKVLFVSSGNSIFGISPIIKNQGESLKQQGIDLDYFTIKGKGIIGYIKNIKPLRKTVKKGGYDIVHAHYSLSAFIASFSGAKSLVVSLMGSDVKSKKYFKLIIRFFNHFYWSNIILKSEDMKISLGIDNVDIIPNGVNLDRFKPMNQKECKEKLNWNINKKHILFAANPKRYEKNFKLAKESYNLIESSSHKLEVLQDVPNSVMPIYHNAADVVLLTSLWEGSPNVIKEAMACSTPIVSTDVGDVKTIFGETKGCYISSNNADSCSMLLSKAMKINSTEGRARIKKLELDDISIAKKLLNIYKII